MAEREGLQAQALLCRAGVKGPALYFGMSLIPEMTRPVHSRFENSVIVTLITTMAKSKRISF